MSVMLSLLSLFLLAMAAGGSLHTNSATAEVTIPSNSAAVTAYWHTMLPNTLMPSAILDLLAPPAGNDVQKRKRVWGPSTPNGVEKINNGNWGPSTKAEDEKSNSVWDPSTTKDIMNNNGNWGPSTANDVEKNNGNWGSSTRNNVQKSKGVWGPSTTNDVEKINNGNWGPSNKAEDQKNNGDLGSSKTNDVKKSKHKWGSSIKAEDQIPLWFWAWGSSTKAEDQNHNGNWAWGSFDVQKSSAGESHIGQDSHKHGTMSNMVFLEEALKLGSTIPCYILPSATLGAPLLRRDVADSIPMSTGNFIEILKMFTPVSNDMATDVWSTLKDCEHPRAIKGETKACVTSVESMVEFAAFVLGVSTYNLGAFSSPDVPVNGVMTGRGYKVAAVMRVREAGDTMTCHGGRFPFAMFMCHAVNPTRVYSVTLEGEDVGVDGAGQRMEVLAVCHLNTSDFHPARMPLHVKPGDAPLCHFISRDSILWAPATPASAHAAA